MADGTSRLGRWPVAVGAAIVLAAAGVAPGGARDFACNACDVKASEVARCQRMDPDASATGLLFNRPGSRTLYKRSSCLQRMAVRYRDAALCEEVRERRSLLFDGSAISRAACEAQVAEAIRRDPEVVIRDIHRLAEVRYSRNGNGRDTNIDVRFSGSYAHRYRLAVSMLDEAGANSRTLQDSERNIGGSTSMLRLFIRHEQIAAAADALGAAPPYRFRLTLALVEPTLREVEQFALLTPAERGGSVEHRVDPGALEREPAGLRW